MKKHADQGFILAALKGALHKMPVDDFLHFQPMRYKESQKLYSASDQYILDFRQVDEIHIVLSMDKSIVVVDQYTSQLIYSFTILAANPMQQIMLAPEFDIGSNASIVL